MGGRRGSPAGGRAGRRRGRRDGAAWRLLVEQFSGLVWSVARGAGLDAAESSDVLQTTWLRLAENLGRMKNPEVIGAWLATTARREAHRVARVRQRVVLTADQTLLEPRVPAGEYSPEQAVLAAEQAVADAERDRRLWAAFRELPVRCQELLRVLVTPPQPSYVEVAAALDMPIGSIGPTRARCLPAALARASREARYHAGRVLAAIDGAWLAHIAAHGTFRADSPLFSALRMDDGPLTVYDFERLRLAPYRLVLPSCDFGLLAAAGADELLGLTSSLLPLGTAEIVASPVLVNDAAAVPLMRTLHERLRAGRTLAGSLCDVRGGLDDDPVRRATAWSFVALGGGC